MTTSLRRRERADIEGRISAFGHAVDSARSAMKETRRQLRKDRCHRAFTAFLHGAQQVGLAEGLARGFPSNVQREVAEAMGIDKLLREVTNMHQGLEVCIRPPGLKKVRGFVRTTGQMQSRRARRSR